MKQLELSLNKRLLIVEDAEIWKYFPENKDYMVSNYGRVKSIKNGKEVLLKQRVNKHGYFQLGLWKNNKMKTWKVHTMVAICFKKHVQCGMTYVVNHIDLNKLNNMTSNLEIITQRENSNRKHMVSSSKFVGVCFSKQHNKYLSYIRINKKDVFLGYFTNELEASLMYNKACVNLKFYKGDSKSFRDLLKSCSIQS